MTAYDERTGLAGTGTGFDLKSSFSCSKDSIKRQTAHSKLKNMKILTLLAAGVYSYTLSENQVDSGVCPSSTQMSVKEIGINDYIRTNDFYTKKAGESCKKKANADVYRGIIAGPDNIEYVYSKRLVRYKGTKAKTHVDQLKKFAVLEFDISSLKTQEDLTALLEGWNTPQRLALTMKAEQWKDFGSLIVAKKTLFSHLFFKVTDVAVSKKLTKKENFSPQPEIPVSFI
ncbi:hypothetical protein DSO57_1001311 [Entomophthora muscae]|uniref:Uncharacterized protein n=2 Tax=Entomophthora muscae TaxID=34485 RepID=A0ACC2U7N8_9FUNG|nr:hypothetical protein DSO57_1001308 [Entomophthora muscae]KAJ9082782.1 hypothetical protein DSO57_1001311 [Entomophthora muscae]